MTVVFFLKMKVYVDPKYFDYGASAPPWQEAFEVFTEINKTFYANPSAIHQHGKKVKQKLLELKKEFCDLLHFHDGQLLIGSTGSELNNTIIQGHLNKYQEGKILLATDVHDSIWYVNKLHFKRVRVFSLKQSGHYDLVKFENALKNDISLVCINHVCNENGAIQPVNEIADICYRKNVKLLIDGAQAIGHVPLNLNELPCTYYTFSGHKFGSVKGAAGAFIRDGDFEPLVRGGKQEWNLRAGTENIPGLASMIEALKISLSIMEKEGDRLRKMKNEIILQLKELTDVKINSKTPDLPGLLSVSFPGFSGREIVGALSMSNFAVSTGSACHSSQMEPSRVIRSMGRTRKESIGSIRISMGFGTTSESIRLLMEHLLDLVK